MSDFHTQGVPDEFSFCHRVSIASGWTQDLEKFYPDQITGVYLGKFGQRYAMPETGYLTLGEHEMYVLNQEVYGYVYYWFHSREAYQALAQEIQAQKLSQIVEIRTKIYRFSPMHGSWYLDRSYPDKSDFQLIGYRKYLEQIEKDLVNHQEHTKFLDSIGEAKSLNYLLFGPPGVGKTTLIRTLASRGGYSVFLVNPNTIDPSQVSEVLNPEEYGGSGLKLLVFEDFDRFLRVAQKDTERSPVMSQILNSLDGFDDHSDVIRFFTGNSTEVIFEHKALINRMAAKFEFFFPTREEFHEKLKVLLSQKSLGSGEEKKIQRFLDGVMAKKEITLRPFTNYVIRYLFEEDYLDQMIEHLEELF